jgi:excinuclease ABC subunit C
VSAAQAVLQEAGLDTPLIGLAKKEEIIHRPGVPEPLALPRDSVALYMLQRLRDEAHRFAITYHRGRREKAGLRSRLDEIRGIGPRRKAALLKKFGSVQGIREASEDELMALPGITRALARAIKEGLT